MKKVKLSKKLFLLFVLIFIFFMPIKSMEKQEEQKDDFSPLIYDAKLEIFKYLLPKDLTALSKINDRLKYIVLDEVEERLNGLKTADEVLKQMTKIKKEYADKNKLNELSNDLMYSLAIKDLKYYMHIYIQDGLKKEKPSVDSDKQNLLHKLVVFDDSDLVECFINTVKIQINSKKCIKKELKKYMYHQDINGNTPLHLAVNCKKNSAKIIALLIKNGTNCDVKDNNENTPLHLAAKGAKINSVQMLLSLGADTAAINSELQTSDEFATASCSSCNKTYPKPCKIHQEVIELILQNLFSQKTNFKYTCTMI